MAYNPQNQPDVAHLRRLAWRAVLLPLAGACGNAGEPAGEPAASCPVISARAPEGSEPVTYSGMSSGLNGTCVVASNGRVLCWEHGDQGDPVEIPAVANARRVLVGPDRTCAIRDGGSVVCWRDLGPPEELTGLCGATQLAASDSLKCAVTASGDVLCRGRLSLEGVEESSSEFVRIPGLTKATAIATGRDGYLCVLSEDGSVVCWGGGPRRADRPGPQLAPIPEISGAVAIAGSEGFDVCAVLADQTVSCWNPSEAPAPVEGLSQVVSLSAGPQHRCAALADGTVRCWGTNGSGELGDGTRTDSDVPVQVQQLEGVREVSVGTRTQVAPGYSCALRIDGSAACWGAMTQMTENGDWISSALPVSVRLPH